MGERKDGFGQGTWDGGTQNTPHPQKIHKPLKDEWSRGQDKDTDGISGLPRPSLPTPPAAAATRRFAAAWDLSSFSARGSRTEPSGPRPFQPRSVGTRTVGSLPPSLAGHRRVAGKMLTGPARLDCRAKPRAARERFSCRRGPIGRAPGQLGPSGEACATWGQSGEPQAQPTPMRAQSPGQRSAKCPRDQ